MRMVVSDDKHLQEVLPLAWLHVDLALLNNVQLFLLSFLCLFVNLVNVVDVGEVGSRPSSHPAWGAGASSHHRLLRVKVG